MADALEDIMQSGGAFRGTLELFACWSAVPCWLLHLPLIHQYKQRAQPGPQRSPVVHCTLRANTQGSAFLAPCKTPLHTTAAPTQG